MNTQDDKGVLNTTNSEKFECPQSPGTENPVAYPKRRFPFYRSLLPWKGDSRRQIIYKTISLLAGCVFVVCAVLLLNDLVIQPAIADSKQQAVMKIYYGDSEPPASSAAAASSSPSAAPAALPERDANRQLIRFLDLQKVNSDIVGWIKVPNTNIDLPVLQANSKSPEYYLDHDYNKSSSKFGSIFADATSPVADSKTKSIILYGHTLNSGRMFTQLNKYKNYDFYKSNPVITFDTIDGPAQWKIISVILTNTLPDQGVPFDYMKTKFKTSSDYLNFVYQLRIRSLFNTGISFNADDTIVLLSTCSYEFTDFREVVVARKVRNGESGAVDASRIGYNNEVVFPDCWYKKNGDTKPVWPTSYEQAVKNKVLSWSEQE